jgi:pimeloyl-ACP methyl ester carboxylesterase
MAAPYGGPMPATPSPTTVMKRFLKSFRSLILAILVGLFGIIVFVLSFTLLLKIVPRSFLIPAWVALVVAVGVALLGITRFTRRGWCSLKVAPLITCLCVVVPTAGPLLAITIDHPSQVAKKGTTLPMPTMVKLSTGSRVAMWKLPAAPDQNGKQISKGTVVHFHGGPGMYNSHVPFAKAETFRRLGYDVVLFDQAGGGLSNHLPIADYTVKRAVADAEAFRVYLGVDDVVLWGNSWGAPLAVEYASKFPQHVAGLVLTSPGAYPGTSPQRNYSKTALKDEASMSAREIAHWLLLDVNPEMAERLADQTESGAWMDQNLTHLLGQFSCAGTSAATQATNVELLAGANPFVNTLLAADLSKTEAPNRLAIPAVIFRGECDYLPADNAARFGKLLGTDVTPVTGQGHGLVFDQHITPIIETFLNRISATAHRSS